MSTTRDIIRRALRLLGVLSAGQQPAGADGADGLERLQSAILALPGLVQSAHWHEVATSAAYTAKEAERVTVTYPGAVTLPTIITWDGCTRPPHDLARVQIIGGSNAGLWVYSASKAAWSQADALTINSEMPFGIEDDDGVAAILAVDMSDEYPGTLGQRTPIIAQISARSFRARFKKYERRHHHRHYYGLSDCDYY